MTTLGADLAAARQQHGAMHGVLELAHIAAPAMALQHVAELR